MQKIIKKKQKNNITQNFRNWFLNQNYKFNIKFVAKKMLKQLVAIQLYIKEIKKKDLQDLKNLIKININLLVSLFDKSLKEGIYKKNTLNRKKIKLSNVFKILNKIF